MENISFDVELQMKNLNTSYTVTVNTELWSTNFVLISHFR